LKKKTMTAVATKIATAKTAKKSNQISIPFFILRSLSKINDVAVRAFFCSWFACRELMVVPRAGFEHATTRSSAERSPRLSYLGTESWDTTSRMRHGVLKFSGDAEEMFEGIFGAN
jgi:hypothetical protein